MVKKQLAMFREEMDKDAEAQREALNKVRCDSEVVGISVHRVFT